MLAHHGPAFGAILAAGDAIRAGARISPEARNELERLLRGTAPADAAGDALLFDEAIRRAIAPHVPSPRFRSFAAAAFAMASRGSILVAEVPPESLLGTLCSDLVDYFAKPVEGSGVATCADCGRHHVPLRRSATRRSFCGYCRGSGRAKQHSDRIAAHRHRVRVAQARRLHAEGETPGTIATRLGAKVATVRGWVRGRRRERRPGA